MATDYTIIKPEDAPEVFGKSYPGELRPLKDALKSEQVAVTYRRMPRHTGSKGGYGHRHQQQEEIFYVLSGKLQFKLDDEIKEVAAPAAVRIAPAVARGVWNEEAEDAELLIISTRIDQDDWEKTGDDFWPNE